MVVVDLRPIVHVDQQIDVLERSLFQSVQEKMLDTFAPRRERTALLSVQLVVDDLIVNGKLSGARQQLAIQFHVLPNRQVQVNLLLEALATLASRTRITGLMA